MLKACYYIYTDAFRPPYYPFKKHSTAKKCDKARPVFYCGQGNLGFSKTMTCWELRAGQCCVQLMFCYSHLNHTALFSPPSIQCGLNRCCGCDECETNTPTQSVIPFVCTPSRYDPNVNILPPTQLIADGGRFCWREQAVKSSWIFTSSQYESSNN